MTQVAEKHELQSLIEDLHTTYQSLNDGQHARRDPQPLKVRVRVFVLVFHRGSQREIKPYVSAQDALGERKSRTPVSGAQIISITEDRLDKHKHEHEFYFQANNHISILLITHLLTHLI